MIENLQLAEEEKNEREAEEQEIQKVPVRQN